MFEQFDLRRLLKQTSRQLIPEENIFLTLLLLYNENIFRKKGIQRITLLWILRESMITMNDMFE
jgi:hypothetical protein